MFTTIENRKIFNITWDLCVTDLSCLAICHNSAERWVPLLPPPHTHTLVNTLIQFSSTNSSVSSTFVLDVSNPTPLPHSAQQPQETPHLFRSNSPVSSSTSPPVIIALSVGWFHASFIIHWTMTKICPIRNACSLAKASFSASRKAVFNSPPSSLCWNSIPSTRRAHSLCLKWIKRDYFYHRT